MTLPQGSALAPRAGRGWPASWVSTGAPAALRNGLWHQLVPFWAHFPRKAGGGSGRRVSGQCFTMCLLPECPQGQHGADCRQRCECRHGGLCDRRMGHCLCQPGWTGQKCESRKWGAGMLTAGTACPGGRWGGGFLSKDIKFGFQCRRESSRVL